MSTNNEVGCFSATFSNSSSRIEASRVPIEEVKGPITKKKCELLNYITGNKKN